MIKTVSTSWPLFFGLGLIMIGNGLQGTLLGVRASIEGFETITIGVIMSLFYFGFLAGSHYVPKMVNNVGHIRVFTALASLASSTVLIHGLIPEAWVWAPVRFFTGFAYAGLYIVVESWLSNQSTTKTRGKIFGVYQFISYGGMVIGQFFLNFADPAGINLFIIASILVSIALLPIALSSRPAPEFDEPETLSLKSLYKISPFGLIGVFAVGFGASALFSIGAVYATEIGMTLPQISTFMALYIFGGVASQIPIGWLSDRFDRRVVIIGTSMAASLIAALAWAISGSPYLLNCVIFLLGTLTLPIYGLCMAYINDHLNPKQFVAASSSAILTNGIGAAMGPLIITFFMTVFGTYMFFPSISFIFLCLTVYGLFRMSQREAIPMKDQSDHINMPLRPTPISMAITEEGHNIMKELEDEEKKKP